MANPVFESSQFPSTMKKGNLDSSETMPRSWRCMSYSDCDLPEIRRHSRRYEAKWFRHQYFHGGTMDRKTCIWSGDGDSWLDKSSGIMWVGVRGMDSICVVSRTGDLDIKRVRHRSLKKHTIESFLHHFRKILIAEIEDLEDPSSKLDFQDPPNKLRQRVGQCIKKPFGIVSVVTDEVDKESGYEASYDEYEEKKRANHILEGCESMLVRLKEHQKVMPHSLPPPAQRDETNTIKFLQERMKSDETFKINETVQALVHNEKKAINFLQEKMESEVAFTMDETIQTAISAFQHLFRKKFKANEIGVTVMDPHYNVSEHEAKYNDVNAKELEIHDIEKHLAVINKPGSRG